ncbi:MAG: NTP transferase domain-containing protein [Acidobacteria bacterium]|nr:NTP transferase domain-containing protein [Acidobacteriota bacterium]
MKTPDASPRNLISARWGIIVLAAGKGTRMKSDLPKVLHRLAGRSLLDHVLDVACNLAQPGQVLVVAGHGADVVVPVVERRGARWALQEPQRGTGDAVRVALAALDGAVPEAVVVLSGDVPLLRPATVDALRDAVDSGAAAAMLTAVLDDPGSYGRVLRTSSGDVAAIVEARDATPAELAVREVNAGVYAFERAVLERALQGLRADNEQQEYYLTDVIAALRSEGCRVAAHVLDDPAEMAGVNTVDDLARLEALLRARTA